MLPCPACCVWSCDLLRLCIKESSTFIRAGGIGTSVACGLGNSAQSMRILKTNLIDSRGGSWPLAGSHRIRSHALSRCGLCRKGLGTQSHRTRCSGYLSLHEPVHIPSTPAMLVRRLFWGFEGGGRIGAGLPFADLASNLPDSFATVAPLP